MSLIEVALNLLVDAKNTCPTNNYKITSNLWKGNC
jgi:hypothetical protein